VLCGTHSSPKRREKSLSTVDVFGRTVAKPPQNSIINGASYETGVGVPRDLKRAVSLDQSASDAGHADAKFQLGRCYRFGTGVERDSAKSREMYRQAAEAEHAKALQKVGTWSCRRSSQNCGWSSK
jgi:hypothetical protein